MYVAPINIPVYLIGRGVAKFLVGSISVFITIIFGVLFLHVNINLAIVNWPLFIASLAIGVLMLAMMGLILAGISLLIVNHVWFIGDAVAGAIFLFSRVPSSPWKSYRFGYSRSVISFPSHTGWNYYAALLSAQ